MKSAPTGFVTLVFSDIQESTLLWDTLGEVFMAALEIHNSIVRATIIEHHGYEVKTGGDSFMVAFEEPRAALAFCIDTQTRLQIYAWPDAILEAGESLISGLRVRMGVHSGEPLCESDPKTGKMDYLGPVVNRAARIASAAHGGQVLISNASWEALGLNQGMCLMADLGVHGLRGLDEPEHIRQVMPEALAERAFPPIRTLNFQNTNLLESSNGFVGRNKELHALKSLFEGGTRLVTLVGEGGLGKTRLAQELGAMGQANYPGGVWLINLTEATTQAGILFHTAEALGVVATGADPVETLGYALAGHGKALFIFDNFERVVQEAQGTLGRWAEEITEGHVLVTSREALNIECEEILRLDVLTQAEAVELFSLRAMAVKPSFKVTRDNISDVQDLVNELDRVCLAIELAAARLQILSLRKLREKLSQRFRLLRTSQHDVVSRHQTLSATLQWSWELLDAHEQWVLAQLSVFHGGFNVEAADKIVSTQGFVDAPRLREILERLYQQSLVRRSISSLGEPRFALLASVQAFANTKLYAEGGIQDDDGQGLGGLLPAGQVQKKHCAYYRALGSNEAWLSRESSDGARLRVALHQEIENLFVALAFAQLEKDGDSAALCFAALSDIARDTGPYEMALRDGKALLESGIVCDDSLARVLYEYGVLQYSAGQMQLAAQSIGQALKMLDSDRMPDLFGQCQVLLAFSQQRLGNHAALEEIRDSFESHSETHRSSNVQARFALFCGWGAWMTGDLDSAREYYSLALGHSRQGGHERFEAQCLNGLAAVHTLNKRHEMSENLYQKSSALNRKHLNKQGEAQALGNLAETYLYQNKLQQAYDATLESLAIFREVGNRTMQAYRLTILGAIESRMGLSGVDERFAKSSRIFDMLDDTYIESFLWAYRGQHNARAGCMDEARQDYERLLAYVREKNLGENSEPFQLVKELELMLAKG